MAAEGVCSTVCGGLFFPDDDYITVHGIYL